MQQHYKGFCLIQTNNLWQIAGFANTFYNIELAKQFIDIMEQGVTKVNANCKPKVCIKCQGRGWYYVNEFFGRLQGRRCCNCKNKN